MMLCLFILHISFNKFRRLIWSAVTHSWNRCPLFMDYHIPWGGKVQLCRRHCDWFTADEDLLCLHKRKLPACCGLLVWPQSSLAPIGEKHPNKHAALTSGFVIFDKMSSTCCVTKKVDVCNTRGQLALNRDSRTLSKTNDQFIFPS